MYEILKPVLTPPRELSRENLSLVGQKKKSWLFKGLDKKVENNKIIFAYIVQAYQDLYSTERAGYGPAVLVFTPNDNLHDDFDLLTRVGENVRSLRENEGSLTPEETEILGYLEDEHSSFSDIRIPISLTEGEEFYMSVVMLSGDDYENNCLPETSIIPIFIEKHKDRFILCRVQYMNYLKTIGYKQENVRKRKDTPDVYNIPNEDERMNWGIEKAKLTLHYFESCLKSPKENQSYFSVKVKIVEDDITEHIWLTNPDFDNDDNLFGVVGNEPIDVKTIKINQKIGIDKDLISDWMIIEGGRLIGGYTIRAIRDGLQGQELQEFDKGMGGIHIDEGEDYFKPDFETPEGAILSLEEAYSNNDLDKAISCKDFNKEAGLMLGKTLNDDSMDDLIEQTAEVLRLSFIKSIQEHGMPNFENVKRAFKRQKISDEHFVITETCYYPDGRKSLEKLNTFKTPGGWRVLNPES